MALPAVSVQLYSIRDVVAADLRGALARLAGIGLTRVEPFDITGDPEGLRAALDEHGLSAPTAHAPLAGADLDRVLDAAATVGVETISTRSARPRSGRPPAGSTPSPTRSPPRRSGRPPAGCGSATTTTSGSWPIARRPDGAGALRRPGGAGRAAGARHVLGRGRRSGRPRAARPARRPRADAAPQGRPDQHGHRGAAPAGVGRDAGGRILAAATAAEVAVLEFDDYAGDLFEGIATGYAFATGLGAR